MSSHSPSVDVKDLIFWLRIYSLISPIHIFWSPLFLQLVISSARYEMNTVVGNSLLILLEKCFRCYVYTDPGPPPVVRETGL